MFSEPEEKYLTRMLGRNEVVLFLGAGFSLDAKNRLSENFPTGWALGSKIWNFLGYDSEYDDTPLPTLYQAFLSSGKKRDSKTTFLNDNLLSCEIPKKYDSISIPYWYKIYTINIDDLIQKVYSRNNKKVKELVYPQDEYSERDQSLEEILVTHLHGKLPCLPEEVVFSTKQYARTSLKHQPLYSSFVYDYATHPTIFLGTDLNEPLFERYIESREGREGFGELRPKSFIITPKMSPVKAEVLRKEYNVHHVAGTTEDFLNWIDSINESLPQREEILQQTFPNLLNVMEFANITNLPSKTITEFASSFKRIPTDYIIKNKRSSYLLGANPSWNDLFCELDIPRSITKGIFDSISSKCLDKNVHSKQSVISITGTAGSGKSTILRRAGLTLSRNGLTVFLCDSDFIPRTDKIVDVLLSINQKVVLLFDNATNMLSKLQKLTEAFSKTPNPPVIVLSLRSNQKDKLNYSIDDEIMDHESYSIEDLDDDEINHLIYKLDKNNLLGRLKGFTEKDRFSEFKYRAKKQILVAMKEATNGIAFNEIIKSEFDEIDSPEAKTLCLCVALITEVGFYTSKEDFVGFSEVSHIESLNILASTLAGTIQYSDDEGETNHFMVRHRILADYMIKHCASLEMLKDAYVRVLSVLASELTETDGSSKKFNLYRALINHKTLYNRFQNNIELAREVFDSLTSYFDNNAHFWLQYGSLEMEGNGGNLILAENYINQAESLSSSYIYVLNAKTNLYYKLATAQDDISHAMDYKEKADELSIELMNEDLNKRTPHISHIHCRGNYYFIQKWVYDLTEKKEQMYALKRKIEKATIDYPHDKKLEIAANAINRAYLLLSTNDYDYIKPEIPD